MTELAELGIKIESGGIKDAIANLGLLEQQGKKVEKATDGMTAGFKSFAVAAAAAAAASAGMIASSVIARHREFTAAISDLSAITGATGKDLQFYNDQAREIGATTTLSATQAAEAFKLIASAKPDLLENKEALAAVTREVVTLAEASGLEMPAAATAVGSALNQFGAGAEEASRFVNVLAAGAKFGASEINETAQALKVVGTVARNSGLSFEQTNAAIQAMAAVSLKGSEAGTGLRGVLLRLSSQSREEFNPEIVGLSQALKNLAAANLTTKEKVKLFGQESITAANALIKEADSIDTMTGKLTGTKTATEQASARTNNLAGDMERMGAAWEDVALTLGEIFDPAMRATVQGIEFAAKVAKSLTIAIGDIGDALGAYAAAAAAVFSLDFEGAKAIMEAREEQYKAADAAIAKIWEEKKATDALNKSRSEAKTVTAAAKTATAEAKIESHIPPEGLSEEEREALEARLTRLQEYYATETELALMAYNEKVAAIQELEDAKIGTEAELNELRLRAAQEFADRMTAIEAKAASERVRAREAELRMKQQAEANFWRDSTSLMTSGSRAMFEIGKAAAIAKAIIDGYEAATAAWAAGMQAGGPLVAAAYTAASIARTASMINSIRSTSFRGGGRISAGGGVSVSGGSVGSVSTGQNFNGGAPAQQAPVRRELRVVVEGDGPHSQSMRKLLADLAATAEDMGGINNLVIG